MEDEKLIECVRRHQHLYDLRHPKSMDNVKKDMAWKEISQEVKLPPSACKQRWQSLRDCYRRALNKKRAQDPIKVKKWKYDDEMSFLEPYLGYKKKGTEESEEEDYEESEEMQTASWPVEPNKRNNNEASAEPNQKGLEISKDSVAVLIARALEDTKQRKENTNDELDSFFLSISATCKKFSPYMQAVLKKKIFNMVSDTEIRELTPNVSSPFTTESNNIGPQEIKDEISD